MPSQHSTIAVTNNPAPAGYRLLELPMELQSLMESPDAPRLTLESSDDSSAILRSPTKSYALRQKNTSNGLFILRPQQPSSSTPSGQGLESIATVHETVELDPVRDPPEIMSTAKHTGSKGRWHEKFGTGR